MTMTQTDLVDLYQQVVAIDDEDTAITPEQQATLKTAYTAWQAAREQVDVAFRSRKDKDQRIAEAQALLEVAVAAYTAAQEPERQADQDKTRRAYLAAEKVWRAIAARAFSTLPGARSLRYVNSVPTDEKKDDGYGERTVYLTTVDDAPIPGCVRGFEAEGLPFRIVARNSTATELSFEVVALTDEEFEGSPGVRKDRFAFGAHVYDRSSKRWSDNKGVEVAVPGGQTRSIEDALLMVEVTTLAITVARLVEAIVVK